MLEKVSGKPYAVLLREMIFEPLGMDITVMNEPAKIIKNRAAGYRLENNTFYNKEYYSSSGTYSAGGWLSSVADMVKWEAALGGEKLLKQSTLKQMWTLYESARGKERERHGFSQGLGWHIPNYPNRQVISHNGGIKGFSTNVTRFIDDEVTVILFCNLEAIARPDVITKGLAEHFIPDLVTEPLQPPI
jgi:CubicO group peptidase (beta-lactamase class C family)